MKPGDVLTGRFRIEREAGTGAMGVVYRAEDLAEGRPVAIKIIRSDPRTATRFAREARLLARLEHPAIVRYVAQGATPDGAPFLAMQWLEGEDLAARLGRGPMSLAHAVAVARRVADALATMHARGVVHRDLKPSNLFLVERDPLQATVLDFGIARSIDATYVVTAAGAVLGTPGYMAPEQARGALGIDARADVFALGCVLFECITGTRVFEGEHVMAILVKILLEEPPRISELGLPIPAALDDLVARMLSKDPAGRPADGAAVRAALDELEENAAGAIVPDASGPPRPPSLSRGEQHVVSLVIAATPVTPAPAGTESLVAPDGFEFEATEYDAPGRTIPSDEAPVPTAELLARFGARVEHLPDGLLIATLSGSGAATDQAARAARCALAIRGLFRTAPVVLATGRALVAGRLPVGPVIDKAVAMLRAVQKEITFGQASMLLDETTAGLLPSRFRLSTSALGRMLVDEEHAADAPRTLLGKPTPFVGREQELGSLVGLFHHVANDEVARAAIVTGAAGLGKSRLRDELLRALRGLPAAPVIWMASGDQLGGRAPLATLARALRGALGLTDGLPLDVARRRIVESVELEVRASEHVRVAAFVGEVLGIPFDAAANAELRAARQEPALMAEQTQRALIELVAGVLQLRPLVIVLEDAHWADPVTMKVLGTALRELHERPLLIVALARPDIDDAFPSLWAERDVLRMALPPLPTRAAERLAARVLGRTQGDDLVRRVVQQAAGNPFFLEELLRASAASGDDGAPMPETVLAMVQKRLEGLAEELRRVLRAASVFGPVFWRGGAAELLGSPSTPLMDGWLSALVEREVVVRRPDGQLHDEVEYGFAHGLVRDSAYLMLTEADKTLAHKLAGDWLERSGERNAALLAEHFELGGENLRAIDKYAQAATQALEADDLESVAQVVVRALGLGPNREQRGVLHMLRAEAHRWRGELEAATTDGGEALGDLTEETLPWYRAIAGTIAAYATTGEVAEATRLAERLRGASSGDRSAYLMAIAQSATYLLSAGKREIGEALVAVLGDAGSVDGGPLLTARCALAEAARAHVIGDAPRSYEQMLRAAEHFELAGDRKTACAARANAGLIDSLMGRLERAEGLLTGALAMAERGGAFNTVAWIRQNLAVVVANEGRGEEALGLARQATVAAHVQRDSRLEAKSRITEAEILRDLGDAAEAEASARRALELAADSAAIRAGALAVLADVLGAQGRDEEAHTAALDAASLLERGEALEETEAAVRLALAESLARVGRLDEASDAIAAARDALMQKAALVLAEDDRELFLRCVPVHARTLARAREWHR